MLGAGQGQIIMTVELTLLVWSVALLLVQITIQAMLLTRDMGSDYNASPRDEERELSSVAGRAERCLRNFLETWPAFIALVLVGAVTDISNGLTVWGAWLYLGFRIAYIPLYLFGVSYIRSAAFLGAFAGLALMLSGLLLA